MAKRIMKNGPRPEIAQCDVTKRNTNHKGGCHDHSSDFRSTDVLFDGRVRRAGRSCAPAFRCGPGLAQVAGVAVVRDNLAQEPAAFVAHPDVKELLTRYGTKSLPIVRVNERVVSKGGYPSRELLAGWCGLEAIKQRA